MVFGRSREVAPEFGVDAFGWREVGRKKIRTDTYERAVELVRQEAGAAPA